MSRVSAQLLPAGRTAIMVCTGGQNWEMLGASDPIATLWAQLQVAAGEGPGPTAYSLDAPVLVPDLGAALAGGRWPLLAMSGIGERGGAVFSFPLHQGAIRVGTLDLYTDTPMALDQAGFASTVEIADLVTVILLAGVRAWARTSDSNGSTPGSEGLGPWWEVAVSTREIHQATGMVAVQLGVDIADAYSRIVARALTEGRPIEMLAADILTRRIRFDPGDSEPGRYDPDVL
ncbi:ANTAR domain-containing protein [Nocardia otitidiscaviarum]|uniref:ANTAR domain-containing protein n=1 Tax=Nocardia otitidiscaviarum TaxID=1823 RepID=A0A516NG82_9NOCA|nr:ANTAR domain-containing protein [Nocardia otitidiscaviarum]MCP9623278.1 ANTAR domain-containing protein [Nocardia otitidiscaviarum]QDP77905.1 ANTAR domain-containing protein [Nocardia otitidiscaviarum]